jgi:hypothetical protein
MTLRVHRRSDDPTQCSAAISARPRSASLLSPIVNVSVSALVSLVLVCCGSHVVVAEEPVHNSVVQGDAQSGVDDPDQGIFMCGTKRCTNHPAVFGGVTLNGYACCLSAERSACGVIELDACLELDQPGRPEPSCQAVTSPQLGVLPGCCAPGGSCGSFESTIGLGCFKIPFLTPLTYCTY